MDKEKQRIAIATICGWCQIERRASIIKGETWLSGLNPSPDEIIGVVDGLTGKSRKPNESDYGYETLPNYLYSLDEMHKAEDSLTEEQWDLYEFELNELIGRNHRVRFLIHATAAQRAEAFLRALNLWEK